LPAYRSALFWFRRDLRDNDNAGLYYALKSAARVHCAFVFDREILDALPTRADRRVEFIHASLEELAISLERRGGALIVLHDHARSAIPALAARLEVDAVFTNGDYEPEALARDAAVEEALKAAGRRFHRAKDHAIFEKGEVLTQADRPYTVFTPYKNAHLRRSTTTTCRRTRWRSTRARLAPAPFPVPRPTLAQLGFERTNLSDFPVGTGMSGAARLLDDFMGRIDRYKAARDFPRGEGRVVPLGAQPLRDDLGARAGARRALTQGRGRGDLALGADLADFYFQILWHFPRVARESFHAEFAGLEWPNDEGLFAAWREARTGYPLVDAAMRQINQTGYMHNRLRMVAASFLTKDLLVTGAWASATSRST
jgi:deoxyribodipyrimidine photo-lyase